MSQALYQKTLKNLTSEELEELRQEAEIDLNRLIGKWKTAGLSKSKVFQLIDALYPDEVDDNG